MKARVQTELVYQCPNQHVKEASEIIKYHMENMLGKRTDQLIIPFVADVGVGKSYQEAK